MPYRSARRRAAILVTLCLSVFLIVVDNTIVNVALPTLVRDLGATTSQLQWIVDAYTLVFAGLLLAAGTMGDRLGRKGVLMGGLAWFAFMSFAASRTTSASELIATRALMGVGAALIFPATLAILVNVFTEPRERARAIALWAATGGVSVALGPVTGGALLEHFAWGSVFLVNVPVALVALVLVGILVPTSRDLDAPPLDAKGLVLAVGSVGLLVATIIEAPDWGWAAPLTIAGFAGAAALLAAFVGWERRAPHPMLDVSVFGDRRFSAASLAITGAFFALFGFVFTVTQYFQFVRGYSTLSAGAHTVPFALFTAVSAPLSPVLVRRLGTNRVVATGLASMAAGFVVAAVTSAGSSYGIMVLAMFFMGTGLGLVMAPATDSIMGSLPPERAGVGSAVNDTTRELGGTLGVAVVGSVFASRYGAGIVHGLGALHAPARAISIARQSIGAADVVAAHAPTPAAAETVRSIAAGSFMSGFHAGSVVAAAVAVATAVAALVLLPRHVGGPASRPERALEGAPAGEGVDGRAPAEGEAQAEAPGAGDRRQLEPASSD